MKKSIDTGTYKLYERSYVKLDIDEFIDFLSKQKKLGATHFILSSYGHEHNLNDIEFYYEREMTLDELQKKELSEKRFKEWCEKNGFSRTVKVNYKQRFTTNEE